MKKTERSDSVQARHGEGVVALILAGMLLLSKLTPGKLML